MSALQVVDTEDTPGHCYQSVPLGGFSHSLTQSRNPLRRRKKMNELESVKKVRSLPWDWGRLRWSTF